MTDVDRRAFLRQSSAAAMALGVLPQFIPSVHAADGQPLPVALVGAGRQGRAILGELQKLDAVRVAAICDNDQRRLRSGARRARDAQQFPDHTQLLEQATDVQAVFIATPTHLHRSIVEDCLAAGRHVYCEAPLAATVDDCRAIQAAARNATVLFMAGYQSRSNPIYKLARTFFRSDAVRDLISMRAQYHRKTSWRTPASDPARDAMLNWRLDPAVSIGLAGEFGAHQFDTVHWYTGAHPDRVMGWGEVRLHDDGRTIADTIQCELLGIKGANLSYHASLANSFEGSHEVFYGSNATIKLADTAGWMFKEADAPTQGWEVYANRQQFHNDEGITLIADATKLAQQGKLKEGVGLPNPPLYYALVNFVNAITDGAELPGSVDDAVHSTIVGIKAHEAVQRGELVSIDLNEGEGA